MSRTPLEESLMRRNKNLQKELKIALKRCAELAFKINQRGGSFSQAEKDINRRVAARLTELESAQ